MGAERRDRRAARRTDPHRPESQPGRSDPQPDQRHPQAQPARRRDRPRAPRPPGNRTSRRHPDRHRRPPAHPSGPQPPHERLTSFFVPHPSMPPHSGTAMPEISGAQQHAYWQALDDAINANDAKQKLHRRSQASSTRADSPPRPDAWPTIWTRSWCTCATHPATAADGGARTCSSGRSGKSSDGPR